MAIRPAQPQSIGGVLDTSFQLYKASVTKVLLLSLLMTIGSLLPTIYLMVKGTGFATNPLFMLAAMQDPQYWLVNLLTALISLVALGAMYLKMDAIGAGTDMGLGEALQLSLGRLLILFFTMVLLMIMVSVGMLLLLIPGLILMVSLLLSFNLAVNERKGPIDSLVGSHKLVWGSWWRTTAILTVGFIVVIVIYLGLGMLTGIVMPIVGLRSADPLMFAMISTLIVSGLVGLFVTPFYVALLLSLYWDLKLRKEGGDLAARIGALSTT